MRGGPAKCHCLLGQGQSLSQLLCLGPSDLRVWGVEWLPLCCVAVLLVGFTRNNHSRGGVSCCCISSRAPQVTFQPFFFLKLTLPSTAGGLCPFATLLQLWVEDPLWLSSPPE